MKLTSYFLIVVLAATLLGSVPPAPASAAFDCPSGRSDAFNYCLSTPTFDWVDESTLDDITALFPGGDTDLPYVTLGFPFKFYENTGYTQVRVSPRGIIFLGDQAVTGYNGVNLRIPTEQSPYNYIAPFWSGIGVGDLSSRVGKIYFKDFLHQTPDETWTQYAVFEWQAQEMTTGVDDETPYDSNTSLSFQLVLYENGDIRFNYGTMDYSDVTDTNYPFTAGIANSDGVDGLQIAYNDSPSAITDGTSYMFTFPGAGVRYGASASARAIGGFIDSKLADIPFTVVNTSSVATKLWVTCQGWDPDHGSGNSNWYITFWNGDKTQPIDPNYQPPNPPESCIGLTPTLQPGERMDLNAHITAPLGSVGNYGIAHLHVAPDFDFSDPGDYLANDFVIDMNVAVPAYFAQAYAQQGLGLALRFVRPVDSGLTVADTMYTGKSLTLAGTARDGYIFVWENQTTDGGANLMYTVASSLGKVTAIPRPLQDNTSTGIKDSNPKVAVYNGIIGLAFARLAPPVQGQPPAWNLFLTVLNINNGNPLVAPLQITSNSQPKDVVSFDDPPAIVGLPNNEFMVVYRMTEGTGSTQTGDLYSQVYRVRGSADHPILERQNETQLTYSTVGVNQFLDPDLALLKDNHVLMTYTEKDEFGTHIGYLVLNTDGTASQEFPMFASGAENAEVVQMSGNGNILIAWTRNIQNPTMVTYSLLNENLGLIYHNDSALRVDPDITNQVGMANVSAAASGGRFVITWGDVSSGKIYYALVDGSSGAVATPAMEYLRKPGADFYISETGEGIAPMLDAKDYRYYIPLVTKPKK